MAAPSLADQPVDVLVHHIVMTPGVMGGRARVRGTRIRVMDIVASSQLNDWSPVEIVANYDSLSLADVHAALAYYYDHIAEVECAYLEDEAFAEEFARTHPGSVRRLPV